MHQEQIKINAQNVEQLKLVQMENNYSWNWYCFVLLVTKV